MAIDAISDTGGGAGASFGTLSSITTLNTGSVNAANFTVNAGNFNDPSLEQFDTNLTLRDPFEWIVPYNGNIELYGNYQQNKIEFDRIDITKIQKVPNTKFRFILVVRNNPWDENPIMYTSEKYHTDLSYALDESNPYFTLQSFNRPFVVEVNIDGINEIVRSLRPEEKKLGVEVYQSLMMLQTYTSGSVNESLERIDHIPLIKYIDWLVSPRNGLDDTYNSVLPVWEIGRTNFDYYYADYDGLEPPSGSQDDTNDDNDTNPATTPAWIWNGQWQSSSEIQSQGVFKTDSNSISTTQILLMNMVSAIPTSYINTNILNDAISEPELYKLRLIKNPTSNPVQYEFTINDIENLTEVVDGQTENTNTYIFDLSYIPSTGASLIYENNTAYKIEIKPLQTGGGGGNNPGGGL